MTGDGRHVGSDERFSVFQGAGQDSNHVSTHYRAMTIRLFLTLCLLTGAGAQTLAHAQPTTAPSPVLSDAVQPGDQVVVVDDTGRERRGTVREVTATQLTVDKRVFEVQRVESVRRTDSLSNGTWTGIAVGLGLTGAIVARCAVYEFAESNGLCLSGAVVAGIVATPAAAAIGRAIDRRIGDREVYRRPSSAKASVGVGWTLRGPALAASVSW